MKARNYVLLYLAALIVLGLVARLEHSPGYMDADYYQLTGQQLASGHGFSEPVLWNYLDDPQALPHPSNAYWMPLASLLAASGMALGGVTFDWGRSLFILLAALIPPLTSQLAWSLTRNKRTALFAGGLAIFSAFYLPYLPTTDTFSLTMVLGCCFFLILMTSKKRFHGWAVVGLGIIVGLMHLARTEGLLWLLLAFLAVRVRSKKGLDLARVLAGYLIIIGPWMLRNWFAFGSLLQPGAAHSLWLTSYDELFSYPADLLTPAHWLASGWGAILASRLTALGQNLLSALAVEGLIFLAPLIVWGAWKLRDKFAMRIAVFIWFALLAIMSFVFPFSGVRGGFFHAAAALQPLAWVLAPAGLEAAIAWGSKHRRWRSNQAFAIFASGAMLLALVLSLYVVQIRVVGNNPAGNVWDASSRDYTNLNAVLDELGIPEGAIVMVNNPPGFALASVRPAIVIPDGDETVSLAAATQFGASLLLLEANHPAGLDVVYRSPESANGFTFIETSYGTQIFSIP